MGVRFKPTVVIAPAAAEPARPPAHGGVKPTTLPAPAKPAFAVSAVPGVRPTDLTPADPAPMRPVRSAQGPSAQGPSSLPGQRHTGIEVTLDELRACYPEQPEPVLERTRAVLAGVILSTASSATWIGFGVEVQEALADLVRERLAAAQQSPSRAIAQHLARLQALLTDVLDAFEGGLFRRSPDVVWHSVKPEVQSLEQLAKAGGVELRGQLKALEMQQSKLPDLALRLQASAVAADYLAHTHAEAADLLLARQASLAASQLLLKEHALHLEGDITHVQELTSLVQGGVLVKLPSVHAQLASLPGKPNDTQRFLAVEKLTDVLRVIQQRTNA